MAALLAQGLARARRLARPVLVSTVTPLAEPMDPIAFFAAGAARERHRFFWSRPDTGIALAGVGAAWTFSSAGGERFRAATAAWRELSATAIVERGGNAPMRGTGPLLGGGFSFDPCRPAGARWHDFPQGLLVLPRQLLTWIDGAAWLTTNRVLGPDGEEAPVCDDAAAAGCAEHPGPDAAWLNQIAAQQQPDARTIARIVEQIEPVSAAAWQQEVADVRRELDGERLQKVVLARELRLRGDAAFASAPALRRLSAGYPECFVFAVASGASCFLGATPELLVRLHDGAVETAALAGTAPRGASTDEDEQLAAGLLASCKERSEHALVVRGMQEALTAAGVETAPRQTTGVVKLRNVQHLRTPVTGRAGPACSVLDLVERLHPTPAVGGYPREAALAAIRTHESLNRGWYAGPVGWIDADGGGEFAVAIRSALLQGNEATVIAGCGIVAGSDPAACEYAESCLKLRPMLTALSGGEG